jgi:hypothetical protein
VLDSLVMILQAPMKREATQIRATQVDSRKGTRP